MSAGQRVAATAGQPLGKSRKQFHIQVLVFIHNLYIIGIETNRNGRFYMLQCPVIALPGNNPPPVRIFKAGIIPFIQSGNSRALYQVRVMQPVRNQEAANLGLEPPRLQIAKGTRMNNQSGSWMDLKGNNIALHPTYDEPLLACALREGEEEIGLKRDNIRRIFDAGCFTFKSTTKGGTDKHMHVFAAEIIDKHNFGAHDGTTAQVSWLPVETFLQEGREDHQQIMLNVMRQIKRFYQNKTHDGASL